MLKVLLLILPMLTGFKYPEHLETIGSLYVGAFFFCLATLIYNFVEKNGHVIKTKIISHGTKIITRLVDKLNLVIIRFLKKIGEL